MARPYDWNHGVEHGTRQGSASNCHPVLITKTSRESYRVCRRCRLTREPNNEDGKVQVGEHNGIPINNEILYGGIIVSDVVGTDSGPIHVGCPLNEVSRPAWVRSDKDVLLNPRSSEIAATDSWMSADR